jgi:hypothetical protein
VVLKDSFAREVAEASKLIDAEEARRASTTDSVPRTAAPPPAEAPGPPRKSPLPWVLVSLVATGFIGGLGYMWMFKQKEEPLVVAPPTVATKLATVAAAPPADPAAAAEVEEAPEPAAKELAPRAPAPAAPPVTERPATEKARPLTGTLQVDAVPFAMLSIDGRDGQTEVVGVRKISLKPGRYTIHLEHPKRTLTTQVTITATRVTSVPFRAFEPQ